MGERERQLVKKLLDDCEKEIREDERQRFLSSIKVKQQVLRTLKCIYTDFGQAEKFCPVAIQLAKQMKKKIKLVKFSERDELGVFDCR